MNCALFLLLCQWWWWFFGISVVVVVKAHILPVVMELELPCCCSDWCGSLVGCCGEVCCCGSCDGPCVVGVSGAGGGMGVWVQLGWASSPGRRWLQLGSGWGPGLLQASAQQATDPISSSLGWGVGIVAAVTGGFPTVTPEVTLPTVRGSESQQLQGSLSVGASCMQPAMEPLSFPVLRHSAPEC